MELALLTRDTGGGAGVKLLCVRPVGSRRSRKKRRRRRSRLTEQIWYRDETVQGCVSVQTRHVVRFAAVNTR